MHDCGDVASDAPAAIFRETEEGIPFATANESNDCQMKRAENEHDGCASNEGFGP